MPDVLLVVTTELSAFLNAADKREHLITRCESYFDELVEPVDLPGPDPIIDPVLRSTIRPLVGRLYDEAVRSWSRKTMPLEQLTPYMPVLAIAAGVLLVLWNERARLQSLVGGGGPSVKTESELTPADRFDKFYALRTWCEQAGETEAVKSLDGVVLPSIVKGGSKS